MSERTTTYTVSPGLGPDATAIVPPTEGMPIWLTVDVEHWHRELTALSANILAWRARCLSPTLRASAAQLADCAAIAAVRPDAVLQDRALKYLREEFAALQARVP